MSPDRLWVGLDLGTSGARAVVIDRDGTEHGTGRAPLSDFGTDPRCPEGWWAAARHALREALSGVRAEAVAGIAVDGTSGSMVAVDLEGRVLSAAIMYNDACPDAAILSAIEAVAPEDSAARGATSGLARALRFRLLRPYRVLHQADLILYRLTGRMVSDANNALKTGYDPQAGVWPDWIEATGLPPELLPEVLEPGTPVGPVLPLVAETLGLPPGVIAVAGTTDGCASFLATGAAAPGEGVSALGTTLTIKLLSDRPIFAPRFGIYSHRILGLWLAGGASNSGGAALLARFTAEEIAELSARIDPEVETGLDYYPLPAPGERFPINDPALAPRLTPEPALRCHYLQAHLEGIAGIEALAYARLTELGAPALTSVRSVGGGAANPVWTRIRARRLGVPMPAARSSEAAHGAALLARHGVP